MEYLFGWGLLLGTGLLLWLLVCFAGGDRGEPQATCGLDGCGTPERARRRWRVVPAARGARRVDRNGSNTTQKEVER